MTRATIWDSMGNVLHRCDSVEEAEEVIDNCGYEEISRTHNGHDVNICVLD